MRARGHLATTGDGERGASTVEFVVAAPFLLLLGLGVLQLGLIYHGKTIVNYATFEAARTGAVNHARVEPMRRELALRLAPLAGGDGTAASAALAIARTRAEIDTPVGQDGRAHPATRIEVLGPSAAAFDDWGVLDPVSGREVIPNSHLRHRHAGEVGAASGLTLADANLLEIEVVHGLELKVPVVGRVLTAALAVADPENAAWYAADRLPLSAVATVRMQSDVWRADAAPVGSAVPDGVTGEPSAVAGDASAPDGDTSEPGDAGARTEDCGTHGLGSGVLPVSESAYASGECAIGTGAYDPPGLPSVLDPTVDPSGSAESSPVC